MLVEWNTHLISSSREKPLTIYNISDLYNTRSYLMPIPDEELGIAEKEFIFLDEQLLCASDILLYELSQFFFRKR